MSSGRDFVCADSFPSFHHFIPSVHLSPFLPSHVFISHPFHLAVLSSFLHLSFLPPSLSCKRHSKAFIIIENMKVCTCAIQCCIEAVIVVCLTKSNYVFCEPTTFFPRSAPSASANKRREQTLINYLSCIGFSALTYTLTK
jgi:hypothetical protein